MASAFISYSRNDQEFVLKLYDALANAGRDAWVDWEGIPPTAEWLGEVYEAIDASDAFIFVLSPDSIASGVCGQEAAHALESKKRIIPVVCRSVEGPEVRAVEALAPLADLNWIFMRESDDFMHAFAQLRFALATDLDYWHLSSELLTRAKKWEAGGKKAYLTLRGSELVAAERWVTQGADKEPHPTAAQLEYIHASRRATNSLQRRLFAGVSVALVIAIALTTLSTILYQVTVGQNRTLSAQALAGLATSDYLANNIDQGLLLSLEAMRRSDSFTTRSALLTGLEYSPYLEQVLHDDTAAYNNYGTTVTALAFSADGRTMMSTNSDGVGITLWDVASWRSRLHIATSDLLEAAALSPDGQLVATRDVQDGLTFWDAQTGVRRMSVPSVFGSLGFGGERPMAFSPDSKLLASVDENVGGQDANPRIDVWDVATGTVRKSLPLDFDPLNTYVAFSRDGAQVAVSIANCYQGCGAWQNEAFVWDLGSDAVTSLYRIPASGKVATDPFAANLAYSPDGKSLVLAGCSDASCVGSAVRWWNIAARSFAPSALTLGFARPAFGYVLALSPDGRRLVTAASPTSLQVWDASSHTPVGPPLIGHRDIVVSAAFSPDGQHLVSLAGDQALLRWRMTPFSPFGIPNVGSANRFTSPVVFAPDSRQVVGADASGNVVEWNLTSGEQVHLLPHVTASTITDLAVSPDGRTVAVFDDAGDFTLGDLTSSARIGALNTGDTQLPVLTQLAFNADGRYLLAQGFTAGLVWDVSTSHLVQQSPSSSAAAFSVDGRLLAIASGENVTVLQTSATGWQDKAQLNESDSSTISALAFSKDGRLVAGLTDSGKLFLWNLATRALMRTLDVSQLATITNNPSLAFGQLSSGGDLVVVSESDSILLWNAQTGDLLTRPIVDAQGIEGISLSPDGQLLSETDHSGVVTIRYVTEAAWQAAACHIADRNLTHTEWEQYFPGESYKRTCSDLPQGA